MFKFAYFYDCVLMVKVLDNLLDSKDDVAFIAKYLDNIDGVGASGKNAYASGETIYLKEYPLLIQWAALFWKNYE